MTYASFDELIAAENDGAQDVTLPSGKSVRVRGLSRYEWFLAGKLSGEGDANGFETHMIAMGMVEPAIGPKQAETWRKVPGGMRDVAAVSDRIRELSGAGDDADKSNVQPVGDES